jgi:peptidyl-prolyl cis-trans isomerase B (cyclophilin B)
MSRVRLLAAFAALILVIGPVSGCGSASTAPSASPSTAVATTSATPATVTATVKTGKGVFVVELRPDKAPKTVANFVKLAKAHFYDGIRVHRVVAGFVMQAGDPLTKGLTAKQVVDIVARISAGTPAPGDPAIGTGGPGWTIKAEPNDLVHDRGVIAMARSQDPDSAGSQFYVTLAPAHQLDGAYTVFGRVASGMDVVDRLTVGDLITSITIDG